VHPGHAGRYARSLKRSKKMPISLQTKKGGLIMAETVIFKDVARDWWERYMLRGNVGYAQESWRRLERGY
jgi:hypothetical protein